MKRVGILEDVGALEEDMQRPSHGHIKSQNNSRVYMINECE